MAKITNKHTADGKGFRTAYQSIVGFVIGLFVVVWAVPGVPDAVGQYVLSNWFSLASVLGLSTGVFAGIAAFIQNRLEDR